MNDDVIPAERALPIVLVRLRIQLPEVTYDRALTREEAVLALGEIQRVGAELEAVLYGVDGDYRRY